MHGLISHLVKNHLDEIVEKSIMNCHCKGVHSVMLLDSPEKTIRLYWANEEHELYPNHPLSWEKMSIGFHAHHCNLTLECVHGLFKNWIVKETPGGPIQTLKFLYRSKIKEGEMKFEELGWSSFKTISNNAILPGDYVHMNAGDIHTIFVPRNKTAAWLVYEGEEDPDYESYCWSNCDPNSFNTSELYLKATRADVLNILFACKLLTLEDVKSL